VKVYDYIVVGSGFGGSVSAMRLSEKGYSVLVIEEGKWYRDEDYPKTNNNLFRYFWFPNIFCRGYQRINFFRHLAALGACGVGGGSINYANTLLKPQKEFFNSTDFPKGTDWQAELRRFYETGSYMLGKTVNPEMTAIDEVLKNCAHQIGRGDTFYPVDVGVFFGEPEVTVPDPYFGGEGPERTGCNMCAGCMTGCRIGAKNMLLKNYLFFAMKYGAEIVPERKAVDIVRKDDYYEVITKRSTSILFKRKKTYAAKNIVLSAGVIGTLKLLFNLKYKSRLQISDRLGTSVRSNSESLIGVRKKGKDVNFAEGIAITSGLYIDKSTHIEGVRYEKGSNGMSIISTLLTDKKKGVWRPLTMLKNIARHPFRMLRMLNPVGWAREVIILLVMQTVDNKIRLIGRKKIFGGVRLKSGLEPGYDRTPVYIPRANDFAKRLAENIGGTPMSCLDEVFFDTPLTAHILGGCSMGKSADDGVVDSEQRLFGHDDFYIADASVIPANPGVNPALTIIAMTERAMDKIPPNNRNKIERMGIEKR